VVRQEASGQGNDAHARRRAAPRATSREGVEPGEVRDASSPRSRALHRPARFEGRGQIALAPNQSRSSRRNARRRRLAASQPSTVGSPRRPRAGRPCSSCRGAASGRRGSWRSWTTTAGRGAACLGMGRASAANRSNAKPRPAPGAPRWPGTRPRRAPACWAGRAVCGAGRGAGEVGQATVQRAALQ